MGTVRERGRRLHGKGVALGVALLCAGCARGDAGAAPSEVRVPGVMPRLERVVVPGLDTIGPEVAGTIIAVSPTGRLAFTGGFDARGRLVTVVDRGGALVARFGRKGAGPGELQSPWLAAFDDTTIVIFDASRMRFVAYTAGGRQRWTTGALPRAGAGARSIGTDSADIEVSTPRGRVEIRRVALPSLRGRVLIAGSDSVLQGFSFRDAIGGARYRGAGYAARRGMVAIGDPYAYRLRIYDGDGQPRGAMARDVPVRRRTAHELEVFRLALERTRREGFVGPDGRLRPLPPIARAIERASTDTLRHFAPMTGMAFDGRDRLWVIGQAHDSVFADVFADTRWLSRWMLPCANAHLSASLNGSWLALVCTPSDSTSDREVEVQRYRVREPGA